MMVQDSSQQGVVMISFRLSSHWRVGLSRALLLVTSGLSSRDNRTNAFNTRPHSISVELVREVTSKRLSQDASVGLLSDACSFNGVSSPQGALSFVRMPSKVDCCEWHDGTSETQQQL